MLLVSSIVKHWLEKMTVEELANEIGLSRRQIIYLRDGGALDDLTRKRFEDYVKKRQGKK